jgi:arabinofuranan 3-O-arabinosyltransferase
VSAKVSVIVTTRNSARTLEACLRSIREQTWRRVELVVVDNRSEDGTPEIARSYAHTFVEAGPERSRQRNIGAEVTSGSALLFLDSDMCLPPPIVAECAARVRRGARAVIIPEVSDGEGFWAACKALERTCYGGDDSIEAARYIERGLFDELGGFDEDLTGEEDWDLTLRIRQRGERIARTETPLIHDEGHLTLADTMRTKFYYGRTMPRYIRKHGRAVRGQLKLLRPAFFRNWRLLGKNPTLTAGMFAMKTGEVAAGVLGTAVGLWADRQK